MSLPKPLVRKLTNKKGIFARVNIPSTPFQFELSFFFFSSQAHCKERKQSYLSFSSSLFLIHQVPSFCSITSHHFNVELFITLLYQLM